MKKKKQLARKCPKRHNKNVGKCYYRNVQLIKIYVIFWGEKKTWLEKKKMWLESDDRKP